MIFGYLYIFLSTLDDSFAKNVVEKGEKMMDDKEPGARLLSLAEWFGDVFDDGFFDFIEFVVVVGIDEGVDILAEEGGGEWDDMWEEVNEFLNFFVNDFLILHFAFKH